MVKYTYVPLSDLKPGVVVNVYAVVTFFKQPFRTKGTGRSTCPANALTWYRQIW